MTYVDGSALRRPLILVTFGGLVDGWQDEQGVRLITMTELFNFTKLWSCLSVTEAETNLD